MSQTKSLVNDVDVREIDIREMVSTCVYRIPVQELVYIFRHRGHRICAETRNLSEVRRAGEVILARRERRLAAASSLLAFIREKKGGERVYDRKIIGRTRARLKVQIKVFVNKIRVWIRIISPRPRARGDRQRLRVRARRDSCII